MPNAYAYYTDPLAGTWWTFDFDDNDEKLESVSFSTPFF